jgi:hypothetical protein
MNGDACSHYKNRQRFPGLRYVILREREGAFPAQDSGALRRIACHREVLALGPDCETVRHTVRMNFVKKKMHEVMVQAAIWL